MNRYFTNKQGAIRRIIDLKRNVPEASRATVVGQQKDGGEVHGLEQVLLHVRIGRIAHFTCSGSYVQEIVFVS
ncbi:MULTISPECIES: hypothetical protein [Caballeronia]|uniref:hypothetical protein n=1 Tax=Caballeronia TaxID=1827195 RepID=UPI00045F0667|nr:MULTISPECIES: hypothetical protein [unclassified Caballeronia]MCE4547441.1 hypothetical protein [Caballeronia sp. PC1]MCE4575427.1 hypothetical protein [Caballeronia sp. CLC5]BAO92628.1 uncharacterized protein BRPE67_ECDS01310 [Burkholderia sp. RPE67]